MKRGDLLWLKPRPSGVCIFLRASTEKTEDPTSLASEVQYEVYHPILGVFSDSIHNFSTLKIIEERIDESIKNLSDYLKATDTNIKIN